MSVFIAAFVSICLSIIWLCGVVALVTKGMLMQIDAGGFTGALWFVSGVVVFAAGLALIVSL